MKKIVCGIIGIAALGALTGCTVVGYSDDYEDDDYAVYEAPYVDAYVPIPDAVRDLIAETVDGYSMPPVSRYGYTIYPLNTRNGDNLPSYVCSDFNGDGIDDYACMFSSVSWNHSDWFLETKLVIVTSTRAGWALSADIELGTVTGCKEQPIEEYWGIRLLRSGTHSVSFYDHGTEIVESVDLYNDGIYLASIDPDERSVFSVCGNDVEELAIDMGSVAKKRSNNLKIRAKKMVSLKSASVQ